MLPEMLQSPWRAASCKQAGRCMPMIASALRASTRRAQVGARSHWGTCLLPDALDTVVVPHRVSCVHCMAVVTGGFDLASIYLISGEGPSQANRDILDCLSCRLRPLNRPFILGGDFQMTADDLASMGWVQDIGGVIVCPMSKYPTSCKCGKGRTIDFFVVSKGLEHLVADCYVVDKALTTPHRPVRLELYAHAEVPQIRILRAPRAFPAQPVFGPRRPQNHWEPVHRIAHDPSLDDESKLRRLATTWMEAYETTMCGLHDIPTELQAKYKGRAEEPKYAWVHPKGARGSTRAKTCEHSRRWRWLGDRLAEFVRLERAAISSSGARKHRKELLVALRKWRPPPHDPELASEREADHVAPGGRAHCRGKLEDDARAAAHGFRRWVKDATLECFSGFEWWLQECDRLGSRYDSRFQMMQEKRFKQWAIDACAKGGRAAHRWTKKPGGSIAAKVAATPQQKVEDTLEFWHEVWACDETAEDWSLMSADGSLPLATPAAAG